MHIINETFTELFFFWDCFFVISKFSINVHDTESPAKAARDLYKNALRQKN